MDRFLNPYGMETMKITMVKQEETFKEQVYELHRLYRVQKMLMRNMKRSGPSVCSQGRLNLENELCLNQTNYIYNQQQKPRMILDLERPATEYTADGNGDGVLGIEDESDIELTLGPTCYNQRKKNETPLTSDSGPSFSSSSCGSNHMKRANRETYKRIDTKEDLTSHEWGLIQVPDLQPSFHSGRKIAYDVEEQLTQDRLKQPPWLFHALSLNTT